MSELVFRNARIVLRDENDGDGAALAERMLANGGAHLMER